MPTEERIQEHLRFLYGEEQGERIWPDFKKLLVEFRERNPEAAEQAINLSEEDIILITYGDQFMEPPKAPLDSLNESTQEYFAEVINGIHILPFYPYSSDDGFSVIDYRAVDPELGSWEHISRLDSHFRLMFDAVINHISRESAWFRGFINGEEPYRDYFITVDPETDLSMIVRPRALPLLTKVETVEGEKYVWTTFSEDQIDLNYKNPQVLLEIVALLLDYIERGAEIIRLDAIAYLWKEPGTPSIHLPQTHHVVKLFRAVLDEVAPGVILITETNVPHEENISYFGEPLPPEETGADFVQGDEAQLVYQFPLAPLVLHTFHSADASALTRWSAELETPYPAATFFNFIASHDGIGVRPAEGILTRDQIQALVQRTYDHGGKVSYKTNKDGSESVYELNITLYDLLNDPQEEELEVAVRRFIASQVIMLSLAGVPGIYVHSLFGSSNCRSCVKETGRARSINRKKFQKKELEQALANPRSREKRVLSEYRAWLHARREHSAFHPLGKQRILALHDQVFIVLRKSPNEGEQILCLVNVSPERQSISIDPAVLGSPAEDQWHDLISGANFEVLDKFLQVSMGAYQSLWLIAG